MKFYIKTILLRRITKVIILTAATVHCGLVGIHLLPDSPLRRTFEPAISGYVVQFWQQNWHLFSPNPGTSSSQLFVKCTRLNSVTPWLDTTSGMRKNSFSHLIGPYPKMRYIHNSIQDQMTRTIADITSVKCGENKAAIPTESYTKCYMSNQSEIETQLKKTDSYKIASRFALDSCESFLNTKGPTLIEMRVFNNFVFPFSERDKIGTRRYFKTEYSDLPSITLTEGNEGQI